MHNEASRATLEHGFGTSNDREVIFHILKKVEIQDSIVRNNLIMPAIFMGPVGSIIIHVQDEPNTHYLAPEDKP